MFPLRGFTHPWDQQVAGVEELLTKRSLATSRRDAVRCTSSWCHLDAHRTGPITWL